MAPTAFSHSLRSSLTPIRSLAHPFRAHSFRSQASCKERCERTVRIRHQPDIPKALHSTRRFVPHAPNICLVPGVPSRAWSQTLPPLTRWFVLSLLLPHTCSLTLALSIAHPAPLLTPISPTPLPRLPRSLAHPICPTRPTRVRRAVPSSPPIRAHDPIHPQPSCNVLSRFDRCGDEASEAANWHCYAYNCPSTRPAEIQNVTWTAQVRRYTSY